MLRGSVSNKPSHPATPSDYRVVRFASGPIHPRPVTRRLRALRATRVFSLNREKFETLLDSHPRVVYKTMRAIMRVVHAVQRRMSMNLVELQNYIYKVHGKY